MENSERTALRNQINTARMDLIRLTQNSEKSNETRNSFERSPLYTFVDEIGRWTVGRNVITLIYLEYKSCKKASYWVHRNGTLLGWGCASHAMSLVNNAAGKNVWTAGSDEL